MPDMMIGETQRDLAYPAEPKGEQTDDMSDEGKNATDLF